MQYKRKMYKTLIYNTMNATFKKMIVLLAVLMAITLLNSSQLCPHDMSNYATLIANPIDCQADFS